MRTLPLLARLASCVPRPFAEAVCARIFAAVLKRHPGLFDRLGEHARKRYAFIPSELPFTFIVEPARHSLHLRYGHARVRADATATGSIGLLLELLEGRSDGDAAFFSRDLMVSGDMEAMVALRNALDDSGVDLPNDIGASAGLLGPLLTRAGHALRKRALPRQGA